MVVELIVGPRQQPLGSLSRMVVLALSQSLERLSERSNVYDQRLVLHLGAAPTRWFLRSPNGTHRLIPHHICVVL
jgi:hypothetical protein